MAIQHATVKAPGETLRAVQDWNANHTGNTAEYLAHDHSAADPTQVDHANITNVSSDQHHARSHAITSASDHTSAATSGKILQANANGLPVDATNTNAEVSGAVSASHARAHNMTGTSDHDANTWKIFYSDGSGDVQELALAASGVLTSNGVAAAPSFQAAAGGAWTKVGEVTLALNATTIQFASLDLDTHEIYVLYFSIQEALNAETSFYIECNGDTTQNHYYNCYLLATTGSHGHGGGNWPMAIDPKQLGNASGFVVFQKGISNDYPRYVGNWTEKTGANLRVFFGLGEWQSGNNVTSIEIVAASANGIKAGSKAMLFRMTSSA